MSKTIDVTRSETETRCNARGGEGDTLMGVRCTKAEAWVYGHYIVRYVGDKEDTIKPLMGVKHCDAYAVTTVEKDGFTFHWCEKHARESNAL